MSLLRTMYILRMSLVRNISYSKVALPPPPAYGINSQRIQYIMVRYDTLRYIEPKNKENSIVSYFSAQNFFKNKNSEDVLKTS